MISSCWINQKIQEIRSLKQYAWSVLHQETSWLKKETKKHYMEKKLVYAKVDSQLVFAPWEWSVSDCAGWGPGPILE